jgi:protein-S-isoprenylcysteine O-methyltransferase Ste14
MPEYPIAIALVIPLIALLFPSIGYWKTYRSEKNDKTKESNKADYNKPRFGLFVFGVLGMWVFWISGILLSLTNLYGKVFDGYILTIKGAALVQSLGLVIFYLGGTGYNWVLRSAGKYIQPAPSGALEDHKLITTGPFGVVRHPLYVSYILILLGLLLIFRNFLILVPLASSILGVKAMANAEEKVLTNMLGDQYLRYQAEVGMLFPKLRLQSRK